MQNVDYSPVTKTAYGHEIVDLVNPETGELVPTLTLQKTVYGGETFMKSMKRFFSQLCVAFDETYYLVLFYIICNMRKGTNEFLGTYKKIGEGTGLGQTSVARGIMWAKENDFIRMVSPGIWMMNPYMLAIGDNINILRLRARYDTLERSSD